MGIPECLDCQRILSLISRTHHLPVMFKILDPVRAREALDPVERLIDWERFQSLASELKSPSIRIHSYEEVDKAAHDFAVSIALACRL
jgi:hypothetical protein